jgi:hypothetical protein
MGYKCFRFVVYDLMSGIFLLSGPDHLSPDLRSCFAAWVCLKGRQHALVAATTSASATPFEQYFVTGGLEGVYGFPLCVIPSLGTSLSCSGCWTEQVLPRDVSCQQKRLSSV